MQTNRKENIKMNQEITAKVYTLPRCPKCIWAKKYLTKRGIDYKELPLNHPANMKVRKTLVAKGVKSAPYVEIINSDGEIVKTYAGDDVLNDPLKEMLQ